MVWRYTSRRRFNCVAIAPLAGGLFGLVGAVRAQPARPRVVWVSAVPETQGGPF